MRQHLAVLFLALLAGPALAQAPDAAGLTGHWSGAGRLYEVKMDRRCGLIAFDLHVGTDLALSGHVGRANFAPTAPRIGPKRIDYLVHLDQKICPDGEQGKDHLVLLITGIWPDAFDADFHLKSTFAFDRSMHPGTLQARRVVQRGDTRP